MTFLINKLSMLSPLNLIRQNQKFWRFLLILTITLIGFNVILKIFTIEIPVYGFHDIINLENPQEKPPRRKSFSTDYKEQDFEAFLDYLLRDNYWFMTTQDIYDYFLSPQKKPIPKEHQEQKKVMITFDDGYESIHTHVLPVLERLQKKYHKKAKVVLFINPAFLGKHGVVLPKVNCSQLRVGYQAGFYDIQSHGLNHENLTQIPPKAVEKELSEAQKQLRKCLQGLDKNNTVGTHLAYPFGAVNPQVVKTVSRYYLSGYLYNSKMLKIWWRTNRYYLPRFTPNRYQSVRQLLSERSGGWF
jgi:peptidoglycan/xylan/chitin deacetylase (PgdA/CDA1 family)